MNTDPIPNTDAPSPPIAREGWPLVFLFAAVSVILTSAAWWLFAPAGWFVGVIGLLLTAWCVWFFRDPPRRIPTDPGAVISPADGVVVRIVHGVPPPELGLSAASTQGMTQVSVFMNVFNVHVNRAPVAGRVEKIAYKPGTFLNASLDKASEQNERCSYALRMPDGRLIATVQIAGLVARRIVRKVEEGAALALGQRFGLIRFGSRVDVFLPPGAAVRVKPGDRTVAGETILASLPPVMIAASAPEADHRGNA